ncbi:twin-arginine translocase TatA/TatE family subunit [Tanticharoenia sakaeratensis]|jgi:sec-independent protein translocase protein TatA|uniref:Sec-independent protein translocase protein TatA n=1 Tax=Tanticharoenia sakaeratensis NBRC 103193 TaxID=1231623 RepID=A0A0D6MQ79_9PROT|nr:twin-arginine translocase TatA/TatE family subunit [Tanticharoenia sakaeratensis]GAN55555.1 sec-independent protein translocase protein TatA [Tanticharoenia sakaeratensis NBRC 103193]GBQ21747.1 Sec-independent protein translocase protein TatA [Tanticharoenia sakaeratensis NBRC 103193]
MGSLSPLHWLIVLAVVLVVFGGGGKISTMMGDFAKGIKSFKKNMSDDESMEAGPSNGGHIAPPSGYPQQGYQGPYPQNTTTAAPQPGTQSAPPRG